MDLNKIFELHNAALKDVKKYPKKRDLFNKISNTSGKHFIGIIGPRGVGKSILLRQIAEENSNSVYISADSIDNLDLFETAKILKERYNKNQIIIDEIHFLNNFQKELKKIYDFIDIKVIFTSSVSLSLIDTTYDLSRRVIQYYLYPFSFSEYIYFLTNKRINSLTLDDIINNVNFSEFLQYEYLFEGYLKGGLYPFALNEGDVITLIRNITDKIIHKDIPSVASLKIDEIDKIEKVIQFASKSKVEDINYSTISQNVGITKYKAKEYIELLQKSFIINSVLPHGTNVLKEPKILFNLPYRLLYSNFKDSIGGIREDFFVEVMKSKNYNLKYLKNSRGRKTPDYIINYQDNPIIIEVGGSKKGYEQFKDTDIKKKLIFTHSHDASGIKRPLFLLGFI